MEISNPSFNKVQLDYINKKYNTIINHNITPKDSIETIMYNSGVLAVIKLIEEHTIGALPSKPR